MAARGSGSGRAVEGGSHVPADKQPNIDLAAGVVDGTYGFVGNATNGDRGVNAVDDFRGELGKSGQIGHRVEEAGTVVADGDGRATSAAEVHLPRVLCATVATIDQQLHRIGHDIGVIQGGADVAVETG